MQSIASNSPTRMCSSALLHSMAWISALYPVFFSHARHWSIRIPCNFPSSDRNAYGAYTSSITTRTVRGVSVAVGAIAPVEKSVSEKIRRYRVHFFLKPIMSKQAKLWSTRKIIGFISFVALPYGDPSHRIRYEKISILTRIVSIWKQLMLRNSQYILLLR